MLFTPGNNSFEYALLEPQFYPNYSSISESQQKTANVEATIKLELYETVEIGKYYESANAEDKNFFEGRMIP